MVSAKKRKKPIDIMRDRLLFVALFCCFFYGIVAWRLIDVAVFNTKPRVEYAYRPTKSVSSVKFGRMDVVDRHGVLLATTLQTPSLYANPRQILDVEEAVTKLKKAEPSFDKKELRKKLSSDRSFVWLYRNITPSQQYKINRLGIVGLHFQNEEHRFYPKESLLSHLLGFTNIDNKGIAGIEQFYDEELRRRDLPLVLTIDTRLQHMLRQELLKAVNEFTAIGASGMIVNPKTGEVLAMVSLPDFNPNNPTGSDQESIFARFNRNTLGIYEMGSTFKMFTIAAALDRKTVTLEKQYDTTQPLRIGKYLIRDFKPKNKWLNVKEILKFSSNIGVARIALEMGGGNLKVFLKDLGLLDAPLMGVGEVGLPTFPKRWGDIQTATISYGHGIAVSPYQLIRAVSAIVNGGVLKPLIFVRPDDPLARQIIADQEKRVMSEKTSERMRKLLADVVENGTGGKVKVPGFRIGGKTGTAEKVKASGGYAKKALLSSFVAAFPIDDPQYVIFVMVDEPKGTKDTFGYATGGWVAAPVVGNVIKKMSSVLGIAPDHTFSPKQIQYRRKNRSGI